MTISSVGPAALTTAGSAESTPNGAAGLGSLFALILGSGAGAGAETADQSGDQSAESAHPGTPDPVEPAHPGTPDPVESALPGTPDPVEPAHPGTVGLGSPTGVAEMLSAAQVMAAAQVVPVTPVLAAALALKAGGPTAAATAPVVGTTTASPVPDPVGAPVPATPLLPGTGAPAAPSADVLAGPPAGAPTGSTAVSAGDPVLPAVPSSAGPLAAPAVTEPATTASGVPGPVAAPASVPTAASVAASVVGSVAGSIAAVAVPEATATTAPQGSIPPAGAPAEAPADPAAELAAQLTGSRPQQDARPDPNAPGRQHRDPGTAEPVNGPAGSQATAATASAAPSAGVTGRPDAGAPAPVTGQVFPEIGRLVSRGDGTHRITLTLTPEALGEVKVVLTVRDGEVHVRMVGSELAQQALRAGAPELQRLLDHAGASSSQIVVGDQSASPDAGPHGGRGTDRETQDHRTAGTRDGDTSARDGSQGGPHKRASTDPTATPGGVSTGTGTRVGVDVTM